VQEKLHRWHTEFGGVDVLQVGVEGIGVGEAAQKASLELFLAEVAPALRAELPSRVWRATEAVPA
jgi:hypothetical protein